MEIIIEGIKGTYSEQISWDTIYLVCEVCFTVLFMVAYLRFVISNIMRQVTVALSSIKYIPSYLFTQIQGLQAFINNVVSK